VQVVLLLRRLLLLRLLRLLLQLRVPLQLQPFCQLLLLSFQVLLLLLLLPLTSSCWQLQGVSLQELLTGCKVPRCLGKSHGQLGGLLQHQV
jgi:hypothetical protein